MYGSDDVPRNYTKAVEWHQKAANQGNSKAQYKLGLMYRDGIGVRQNKLQAKEWFGKVCDSGVQLGCDRYRELNQR